MDNGQKKFKSRLLAPTIFLEEPFGPQEGLCHFRDKVYAVEMADQADNFEFIV